MTKRMHFTMAAVAKLKAPAEGRIYVYDQKIPGLAICVTDRGVKTFYWVKKFERQTLRERLGRFPEISVDDARTQAEAFNVDKSKGINPADSRRKQRGELTLGELWNLYLEFHATLHKKQSSLAADKGAWKRYLADWSHRRLSTITSGDIRSLHAKVGKANGHYAANRMLALLSKMFNTATDKGEWKAVNPCRGIKLFAEKSRDRFLQPEELPRFLTALKSLDNQHAADAFRLMLFTGARKSNVLGMQWADVDLAGKTWRVPDTKANEPQWIHLTAEVVEVLTKRKADDRAKKPADRSPFVFPARTAGAKAGHLQDVTTPWESVCTAADLDGLRMHDLRRTLGSWQAAAGTSLLVIGKSLGHRQASTTEVYARLNLAQVRESVDKAVAAMMAAGKQETEKNMNDLEVN